MKRILICLLSVFLIIFCLYTEQAQSKIANSVIRLHILANSNSPSDQSLKLDVRDFVLEKYGQNLTSSSRDEAIKKIYEILPSMIKEISEFSGENVKISLCEENFSTRNYENFTLPAGDYLSLKIILGEGKGKNWWCVMYPPLCFTEISSVKDKDTLKSILSPDEYELITSKKKDVIFKFKTLEIINKIKTIF